MISSKRGPRGGGVGAAENGNETGATLAQVAEISLKDRALRQRWDSHLTGNQVQSRKTSGAMGSGAYVSAAGSSRIRRKVRLEVRLEEQSRADVKAGVEAPRGCVPTSLEEGVPRLAGYLDGQPRADGEADVRGQHGGHEVEALARACRTVGELKEACARHEPVADRPSGAPTGGGPRTRRRGSSPGRRPARRALPRGRPGATRPRDRIRSEAEPCASRGSPRACIRAPPEGLRAGSVSRLGHHAPRLVPRDQRAGRSVVRRRRRERPRGRGAIGPLVRLVRAVVLERELLGERRRRAPGGRQRRAHDEGSESHRRSYDAASRPASAAGLQRQVFVRSIEVFSPATSSFPFERVAQVKDALVAPSR